MPFQMRYFDEGRREPFFSSWQQYVPASSLNYDLMTQKVAAIKGALLRAFHVFDAQRTSLFYLACRSLNSACIYIFLSIPHSQAPQVRGVWIRTLLSVHHLGPYRAASLQFLLLTLGASGELHLPGACLDSRIWLCG